MLAACGNSQLPELAAGLTSSERLEADLDGGHISLDDYVVFSLYGILFPEVLPERYQAPRVQLSTEDGNLDATGDYIHLMRFWNELEDETQAEIDLFLERYFSLEHELIRRDARTL